MDFDLRKNYLQFPFRCYLPEIIVKELPFTRTFLTVLKNDEDLISIILKEDVDNDNQESRKANKERRVLVIGGKKGGKLHGRYTIQEEDRVTSFFFRNGLPSRHPHFLPEHYTTLQYDFFDNGFSRTTYEEGKPVKREEVDNLARIKVVKQEGIQGVYSLDGRLLHLVRITEGNEIHYLPEDRKEINFLFQEKFRLRGVGEAYYSYHPLLLTLFPTDRSSMEVKYSKERLISSLLITGPLYEEELIKDGELHPRLLELL